MSYFKVTESNVLSIMKSLDSSKAHGCDNLSIRMIKMCSESITLPLKIIFRASLKKEKFPEIWKKQMQFLYIKKEDNTFIINYRPISLLPIFSKISGRLIYNSLFNYFLRKSFYTFSDRFSSRRFLHCPTAINFT